MGERMTESANLGQRLNASDELPPIEDQAGDPAFISSSRARDR